MQSAEQSLQVRTSGNLRAGVLADAATAPAGFAFSVEGERHVSLGETTGEASGEAWNRKGELVLRMERTGRNPPHEELWTGHEGGKTGRANGRADQG